MFVFIPPHQAVSDVIKRIKGRTSRKIQMEFPNLRKKFWGWHFWARGYFCTTSGRVNGEIILLCIEPPNSTNILGSGLIIPHTFQ